MTDARTRVQAFLDALPEPAGGPGWDEGEDVARWGPQYLRASDLRAVLAAPCPHVVTADGGTSHCTLAESSARAAADARSSLLGIGAAMVREKWADDVPDWLADRMTGWAMQLRDLADGWG